MLELVALDLGDAYKLNETDAVKDVFATPSDLINILMPNLFAVAGVFLFFVILIAGFKVVTGDSTKKLDEGKKQLLYGFAGLILLFSAYWIAQIVTILTGVKILGG